MNEIIYRLETITRHILNSTSIGGLSGAECHNVAKELNGVIVALVALAKPAPPPKPKPEPEAEKPKGKTAAKPTRKK